MDGHRPVAHQDQRTEGTESDEGHALTLWMEGTDRWMLYNYIIKVERPQMISILVYLLVAINSCNSPGNSYYSVTLNKSYPTRDIDLFLDSGY